MAESHSRLPREGGARRPLTGRTIVTTRERPGRLDANLVSLGADVVHVPLIETVDPADGGAEFDRALSRLDSYDWIVLTSPNGAERVAPSLRSARCRIGVVGTRTADVVLDLVGRSADVVPVRQTAADLAAAMPQPVGPERILLAQADRADPASADRFRAAGYEVDAVVAYRTVLRPPTDDDRNAMLRSDAVAFASGSAVEAWFEAVGVETPPVVVVIGPTTEAAAERFGLTVSVVAADHSVEGLTVAILRVLGSAP